MKTYIVKHTKQHYENILNTQDRVWLQKKQCFLRDVSQRMSINNPLSTLFLGIVENKLGNMEEAQHFLNLSHSYLEKSDYWQKRFEVLDLKDLYGLN